MAAAGIPMRLDPAASNMFTLERLRDIVAARAASDDKGSYTRSLVEAGIGRISKKFGEEAVETIIAACAGDAKEVVSESADLLYHLMVLLHARGIVLEDVFSELQRRTRQSGIAEKAARKSGGADVSGKN
jgi:phosphoribosyl-ATP pyrophosphohydrolase